LRRYHAPLHGDTSARAGVEAVDDWPMLLRRVTRRQKERVALTGIRAATDALNDRACCELIGLSGDCRQRREENGEGNAEDARVKGLHGLHWDFIDPALKIAGHCHED